MSIVFAGSNKACGCINRVGIDARFNSPQEIAIDQQTGTLFVCDYFNNNIRKITPHGISLPSHYFPFIL
jgi:DNA-binding beta-propeller fold protein YncE